MNPNPSKQSIETKRKRKEVIHSLSQRYINGEDDVIQKSSSIYPWLSRHMVHGCVRRVKVNAKKYGAFTVASSDGKALRDEIVQISNVKGGRPKGATIKATND